MFISHDSQTPAHGKQVITACAFIHKLFDGERKIFLPKRASTKKFLPNVYELPGGHIDFGEEIITGLQREIHEELTLEINVGDPFFVFTYYNDVKGSHSTEVIYFATFKNSLEQIILNPHDHSDYIWLSENEVTLKALNRPIDDINHPEYKAILKGFSLLKGQQLNFG